MLSDKHIADFVLSTLILVVLVSYLISNKQSLLSTFEKFITISLKSDIENESENDFLMLTYVKRKKRRKRVTEKIAKLHKSESYCDLLYDYDDQYDDQDDDQYKWTLVQRRTSSWC
mgnify:CR=1 FL=1